MTRRLSLGRRPGFWASLFLGSSAVVSALTVTAASRSMSPVAAPAATSSIVAAQQSALVIGQAPLI